MSVSRKLQPKSVKEPSNPLCGFGNGVTIDLGRDARSVGGHGMGLMTFGELSKRTNAEWMGYRCIVGGAGRNPPTEWRVKAKSG